MWKKEKIVSTLTTARGIERNLTAKRFVQKVIYSPQTIAITAFYGHTTNGEGAVKTPTPLAAGLGGQSVPIHNSEFVPFDIAPDPKHQQTFEIILPNLIHQSKRHNLT